jgi:hypothetical protein
LSSNDVITSDFWILFVVFIFIFIQLIKCQAQATWRLQKSANRVASPPPQDNFLEHRVYEGNALLGQTREEPPTKKKREHYPEKKESNKKGSKIKNAAPQHQKKKKNGNQQKHEQK